MNGKAFFDTNVLLYMYGGIDPAKRERAQELFQRYTISPLNKLGEMTLSTQVVQEFHVAGSRKLGMPRRELEEITLALLDLPLTIVGPAQIRSALRAEERYKISFWEGLIIAAAESAGAEVLFTENLNDGQRYGTVVARNPFAEPRIEGG